VAISRRSGWVLTRRFNVHLVTAPVQVTLLAAAETDTAAAVTRRKTRVLAAAAAAETAAALVVVEGGFGVPQDLVATAVSESQINLTWGAVTGAEGYDVLRGGVRIAADVSTNSFSDYGLAAGTLYTYCVKAVRYTGPTYADGYTDTY
jgi:hypothetical protein